MNPRLVVTGTRRAGAAGFTLIEVLVALTIVAVALIAGLRSTASLSRDAQRQADALLAHVCAENELIKMRLSRQMPGVGDHDVPCEQAGRSLTVKVAVRPTPNPNFRRVDAQVFDQQDPILRISTVVGQL
ncbi:MAG: type II secretion system minor pseudopilin GspI [Rhodoferax sp.]|nr:type II secretion system minor pseudopilin GspI [Rhodoferax sp.]